MNKKIKLPNRRSIRLKEYDYRQTGYYYITICSYKRRCIFGNIKDEKISLSSIGNIVKTTWEQTTKHFHFAMLNEFVVMSNHFHAIIYIEKQQPNLHLNKQPSTKLPPQSLATIIRSFKSAATRQSRSTQQQKELNIWQKNYYEHIVRNETDLNQIQQYILNNPLKWHLDSLNPNRSLTPLNAYDF